ncbi:MAG: DUF1501 domain-containing protein [Armatimonadaceae bacterium]
MPDTTNKSWFSCDGNGSVHAPPSVSRHSRRQVVTSTVAATLAAWLGKSALHNVAFAEPGKKSERDVLVVLFLRGGADGLSVVAPYGEDAYYRNRPTLALKKNDVVRLDDFFGLHPALTALEPFYKEGKLAAIHAVGSGDDTRSHFEAMATMERGVADQKAFASSGWLARHLLNAPVTQTSPLRAVAFDSVMPDMLRGAVEVSVMQSLEEFRLHAPDNDRGKAATATLAALYGSGNDAVVRAGRETLAVLDAIKKVDPTNYKPQNGATYPESHLGNGLRQTAFLIRANLGMEVAALSRGGWDTHVAQGGTVGLLAGELKDVGDSLAAFAQDLGSEMERVTVLVQTEFGRRVYENDGLGTDHGRASMMLLLGGGIHGGKVYTKWPGLEENQLEQPGDLRVTTDYRTVLAEIVEKRLRGAAWVREVFPSVTAQQYLGLARVE